MMSSGVSRAWPISCSTTWRSRSSSCCSKVGSVRMSARMSIASAHVVLQHPHVEGRLLAAGIGVEIATDGLDLFGDLARADAGACP